MKLKIVPMEAERELNQDRSENFDKTETNKILYKIFPKREIPKIPSEFRAKKLKRIKTDIITKDSFGKSIELGKLVWIRKRLPSSSVQGGSAGTNPTGGLRLVQDDFIDENKTIDQTKYFRYKIFGKFNWSEIKKTPLVEVAIVPFKINIFGKYIGEFNLQIRHKPSGEAGQHNYTTSISWGEVSEIIRKANLTGRKLELYKSKGLSKVFQIIIE
ncbi:MAG: hypothetical protein IPG78_06750 [Ignavibacteria bacterium]|nr:hypothetical protein [Ignavibacteria bacterium]